MVTLNDKVYFSPVRYFPENTNDARVFTIEEGLFLVLCILVFKLYYNIFIQAIVTPANIVSPKNTFRAFKETIVWMKNILVI